MFSQETLKLVQLIKFGYYLRLLPFKVSLTKNGILQAVDVIGSKFYYYQYLPFVSSIIGIRILLISCIITYDLIDTDIQLNERLAAYEVCSLLFLIIIIHLIPMIDGDSICEVWEKGGDLVNLGGKFFNVNPNEKDGIELLLKSVLISLAVVPIILCFVIMFVVHNEFHCGAAIKGLIIWFLEQVELSDHEYAYSTLLLIVGIFSAFYVILDLVILYHLMVCTIVSLRAVQQILKALIKSTCSRSSSELFPIYRILQIVSYRGLKLFRNWLVTIIGSALAVIILTGFCLVKCFQECGIFLTGLAIIVFCLASAVLCHGLSLAGEFPTLCKCFFFSVCTTKKYEFGKLEKRVMRSCAPIQMQFGSFLVIHRDSCAVWLDFISNRIIDLVVTF